MNYLLLALLMSLSLLLRAAVAAPVDGAEFLPDCQNILEKSESREYDSFSTGYCLGVIQGTWDALFVASARVAAIGQESLLKMCPPEENISGDQAVRIVVKYLEDHPEELHIPLTYLVHRAFVAAFPCNSPGK